MVAADATRPGDGWASAVASRTPSWGGRGTCTGMTDMYPMYAKGADILAFDIYPVNEGVPLEMVAAGVDNLHQSGRAATKPVIADLS